MECLKLHLEVLAPIRIGSYIGQISTYDYVVDGGFCYVMSEERLSRFLSERGLSDKFAREIKRSGKAFNIKGFLSSYGIEGKADLERLADYTVQVHEDARPLQLLPMIRDVNGMPYIPGSSIKGAMRTAVLYSKLKKMRKEEPQRFEDLFIAEVRSKIKRVSEEAGGRYPSENKRKRFAAEIEQKLTKHFDLENISNKYKHGPHTDIFRCLKVSDALPVEMDCRVYDFRVLDKQSDGSLAFESPIFAEAISPGSVFEFQVTWDSWLADRFRKPNDSVPLSCLQDVLDACREFARDQVAWESRFFQNCNGRIEDPSGIISQLNGMEADLRLGWGCGLMGASLSLLLPIEMKHDLRDLFYRRHASGVNEFPKSRRVLVERGRPASLLGFCRLRSH